MIRRVVLTALLVFCLVVIGCRGAIAQQAAQETACTINLTQI